MPVCTTPSYQLNYTHNGVPSDGPHLLLIHGAGGQIRDWPGTWRMVGDAAASIGLAVSNDPRRITNYSFYAIDLPGHGASSGAALSSVDDYAEIIETFLEIMDLRKVIVVGHSMGGAIALTLAARNNPRLIGQIIVGCSATLQVTDDILTGLKAEFEKTVDFIVKYSWHRETTAFFPDKARQRMRSAGSATVHADFYACSKFDVRSQLAAIDIPTLVIASQDDRMVPLAKSQTLAEAIHGA